MSAIATTINDENIHASPAKKEAATPTRNVLKEITNTNSIQWSGKHIKFDDEGNTHEVPKKDQSTVTSSDEEKEVYEEDEGEEQLEEEGDEEQEGDVRSDDPSVWEIREPQKVQWSGTHTFFKEDEEDDEEDTPSYTEPSPDIMDLEAQLSKLSA